MYSECDGYLQQMTRTLNPLKVFSKLLNRLKQILVDLLYVPSSPKVDSSLKIFSKEQRKLKHYLFSDSMLYLKTLPYGRNSSSVKERSSNVACPILLILEGKKFQHGVVIYFKDLGSKNSRLSKSPKLLAHDLQYILDMNDSCSPTFSLSVLFPVFRYAVVIPLHFAQLRLQKSSVMTIMITSEILRKKFCQ